MRLVISYFPLGVTLRYLARYIRLGLDEADLLLVSVGLTSTVKRLLLKGFTTKWLRKLFLSCVTPDPMINLLRLRWIMLVTWPDGPPPSMRKMLLALIKVDGLANMLPAPPLIRMLLDATRTYGLNVVISLRVPRVPLVVRPVARPVPPSVLVNIGAAAAAALPAYMYPDSAYRHPLSDYVTPGSYELFARAAVSADRQHLGATSPVLPFAVLARFRPLVVFAVLAPLAVFRGFRGFAVLAVFPGFARLAVLATYAVVAAPDALLFSAAMACRYTHSFDRYVGVAASYLDAGVAASSVVNVHLMCIFATDAPVMVEIPELALAPSQNPVLYEPPPRATPELTLRAMLAPAVHASVIASATSAPVVATLDPAVSLELLEFRQPRMIFSVIPRDARLIQSCASSALQVRPRVALPAGLVLRTSALL